jgi:uncharacterized protein YjbI with pentapeptide repeats
MNSCNPDSSVVAIFSLFTLLIPAVTLSGTGTISDWIKITRQEVLEVIHNTPPGTKPDLKGKDFRGQDMSGIDFQGADFFYTHMRGVNLSGSNFENANLDLAIMPGANLEGVNLRNSTMNNTELGGANLRNADLTDAVFMAKAKGANLEGATMVRIKGEANMNNQSMGMLRTILDYANLENANLEDANLSFCTMQFGNLQNANLRGANLTWCDLSKAVFTGADMTGVNLTKAKLTGTVFKKIKGRDTIVGLDTARDVRNAEFEQ